MELAVIFIGAAALGALMGWLCTRNDDFGGTA